LKTEQASKNRASNRLLLAKNWLRKPSILAATVVLVSLVAGVVYAVVTGLNSSGVQENKAALAAAGVYPGSVKLGTGSSASFPENGLPVPRGVVSTVAYRPPTGTRQIEIANFYLAGLRPDWTPKLERSLPEATGERSLRVTFSKDDECLVLLTAGLLVADESQRAYTLSAYPADGGNC
jgi:hypothetical protein